MDKKIMLRLGENVASLEEETKKNILSDNLWSAVIAPGVMILTLDYPKGYLNKIDVISIADKILGYDQFRCVTSLAHPDHDTIFICMGVQEYGRYIQGKINKLSGKSNSSVSSAIVLLSPEEKKLKKIILADNLWEEAGGQMTLTLKYSADYFKKINVIKVVEMILPYDKFSEFLSDRDTVIIYTSIRNYNQYIKGKKNKLAEKPIEEVKSVHSIANVSSASDLLPAVEEEMPILCKSVNSEAQSAVNETLPIVPVSEAGSPKEQKSLLSSSLILSTTLLAPQGITDAMAASPSQQSIAISNFSLPVVSPPLKLQEFVSLAAPSTVDETSSVVLASKADPLKKGSSEEGKPLFFSSVISNITPLLFSPQPTGSNTPALSRPTSENEKNEGIRSLLGNAKITLANKSAKKKSGFCSCL
jgi:hypothetical protein